MTKPLKERKVSHVNPNCKDSSLCNPHGEIGEVTYKEIKKPLKKEQERKEKIVKAWVQKNFDKERITVVAIRKPKGIKDFWFPCEIVYRPKS